MTFTALRVRSQGSLLFGTASPEALVARALETGHEALALTDRDNLYLAIRFYDAARAAGLRPLLGAEVSAGAARAAGALLLAVDRRGYSNLCAVVTAWVMSQAHWPLATSIAAGIAAGAATGLVNGIVAVRLGLPAFIATLGMLYIARGLNYLPNSLARGLRENRTRTVGVIFNDLNNPFYTEILGEIGEKLNEADYSLVICYSHYDVGRERRNILSLLSRRVDGMIISPIDERSSNIDVLAPGAFVSLVVPLVVFFAFQRHFVQGVMAGSVK